MKSEAKRRYKRKCHRRHIDFYIKDKELYEFSKTINFNQTIKDYLKSLMEQTEEVVEQPIEEITNEEAVEVDTTDQTIDNITDITNTTNTSESVEVQPIDTTEKYNNRRNSYHRENNITNERRLFMKSYYR